MVFKSDLKVCDVCGEVFEATVDPEQEVEELPCPYLDCDAEGEISKAGMYDRYGQWRHDRLQTYIFYRGKVRVAVKNLYWRPVRRYNAFKRWVGAVYDRLTTSSSTMRERAEDDLVTNFGYSQSEVESMTEDELLDAMAQENQDNFVDLDVDEPDNCPHCGTVEPDELAEVSDNEYRCENCITGQ